MYRPARHHRAAVVDGDEIARIGETVMARFFEALIVALFGTRARSVVRIQREETPRAHRQLRRR